MAGDAYARFSIKPSKSLKSTYRRVKVSANGALHSAPSDNAHGRRTMPSIRAAVAAACVAVAVSAPANAERLTVSQWAILVNTLPYAVALEKGYWKEEGLAIDGIIASHGGGTSVRNMLASDLPVAEMALPAAIAANKQGIDIRIVAD